MKPQMPLLYFFVGTTAEFIKLLPVIVEAEKRSMEFKIISSGQNDISNSELWSLIQKKKSDLILSTGPAKQTALSLLIWYIKTFLKSFFTLRKFILRSSHRSIIVVHGDTISTLMGALLGKVHRCDICHVEAGLRSFNYLRPFPEEICRVLVSRLTSYAFCPNDWAMNNIKTRKSRNFNTLENTLLDSMSVALSAGHGTNEPKLSGKYFLFVLHRQENLFNTDFVERIIAKIIEESQKIKCVFILHKPTETTLEKLRLLDRIKENKNIICLPRQSYITFTRLLHECQFIVTDGGSNQEESYYFGKPCLVLRSETERIEGLDRNVLMSKLQFNIINEFFLCPEKYCYPPVQLNSRPSQVIIDKLMEIPGASRLHPSLA